MNQQDIAKFKDMLLTQKSELESQIGAIGKRDKSSPGGWEATSGTIEADPADENELADKLEELDDNNGILTNLEKELSDVNLALDKIQSGKYGICETCGKPIEIERLEANPSARVSIKHGHNK